MTEHYLDNSATTRVLPQAAQAAVSFMTEHYGNPSSLHTMGYRARCALDKAREAMAYSLGAKPETVYFTSGGTESNGLAILGAANARKRMGGKIVTTAIEHPSVLSAMAELERQGFQVKYLKPDRSGEISAQQLAAAIDNNTILVSIMLVNNETGVILPVAEAAKCIRRCGAPALLHTDAVQAYLKTPLSVRRLGADLITVSGHKVHAPKGIGALYVAESVHIKPIQLGGGQERGLRSGTQAMPLIAALAEAVRLAPPISRTQETARFLNSRLRAGLADLAGMAQTAPSQNPPEVVIHSPADGLPHILNFSAGRVRAETMLHFLSREGIYLSSGSACGKAKPSHVLTAMDVSPAQIGSALRVSFSHVNKEEDVDALLSALKEGLRTLAGE